MSRKTRREFYKKYGKKMMLGSWAEFSKSAPKPKPIVNMTKRIANDKPTKYEVSDKEFQII